MMLDTTINQSTEFPLFGTMASPSSRGMEAIQIQRPLPTESYSWNDFPIGLQDHSETASASMSATTYNHAYYDCASSHIPQHSTETSSSSVFSSLPASIASTASESSISTVGSSSTAHRRTKSLESTTKRRHNVRFAPSPHVRTYSLVLGDHPFCDDGLAIELGWDYNEEENTSNNTPQQQPMIDGIPSSDRIKTICQRRSYLSRKQLLLNVAGCTKEELDRRKKDSELEARNHREDYVYHQALAKTMLR